MISLLPRTIQFSKFKPPICNIKKTYDLSFYYFAFPSVDGMSVWNINRVPTCEWV